MSATSFAVFFALFLAFEHPGTGVGRGYYLSIVLAALATGPWCGAAAGFVATGLFALGAWFNPHVTADLPAVATWIRSLTYVGVGGLVGFYASRNRTLTLQLTALTRHLQALAERDVLTDLPNTRAFEVAISNRLKEELPFALLVADLDGLAALNALRGYEDGNDALRKAAERLTAHLPADSDLARVGSDEFALLVPHGADDDAARLADRLESRLRGDGCRVTFGWAVYPREGTSALSLYRVSEERLYARKLLRGERRGALSAA